MNKKVLTSLLFASLLSGNALAADVADEDVLYVDKDGNNRIDEYNISSTLSSVAVTKVVVNDASITVQNGDSQSGSYTINEDNTTLKFSHFVQGVYSDGTNVTYQAPLTDKSTYLIQNKGNLAYLIDHCGDSEVPADGTYEVTKSIDAGGHTVKNKDQGLKDFSGKFVADNGVTISNYIMQGDRSAVPFNVQKSAEVKVSIKSAAFPLTYTCVYAKAGSTDSRNVNADLVINKDANEDGTFEYKLNGADIIDLAEYEYQLPSDATKVDFVDLSQTNTCKYKRKGDYTPKLIVSYLPFDITKEELPSGSTVYKYRDYYKTEDNKYKLHFDVVKDEVIKAGTPMLIKNGNAGVDWNIELQGKAITLSPKAGSEPITGSNGMYGTYNTVSGVTGTFIKINTAGDGLTFTTENGHSWPFRCGIRLDVDPVVASTATFIADFEEESGVEGVDVDAEEAIVDVYSLQGALVAKSVKASEVVSTLASGVYVTSNGNKLIVK